MLPSQFLSLDISEKAFVCAAIDLRIEREEKERKKAKAKSKGRRR